MVSMVCLFPDGQNCIVWPFCFAAKHMKARVSVDSSLIIENITKRWLSRYSSAIYNGSFSYFSWVSQMKLMSNNIIILISGGSHRASSVSLRKFQMAKINEWLAYQCCTDYSSGSNERILATHSCKHKLRKLFLQGQTAADGILSGGYTIRQQI